MILLARLAMVVICCAHILYASPLFIRYAQEKNEFVVWLLVFWYIISIVPMMGCLYMLIQQHLFLEILAEEETIEETTEEVTQEAIEEIPE
jgi:hypothetical protein